MKFLNNIAFAVICFVSFSGSAFALSSPNVPLDSPVYEYLDKLSGFGLVSGDVKGVRPYSRAEAARLVKEAEGKLAQGDHPQLAAELVSRLKQLIPRETGLYDRPGAAPSFDWEPLGSARLRYVHLDGAPRSYFRPVHDPGHDGVFGIGSGLRPATAYPNPIQQRGFEGTPLMENNNGVVYGPGSNVDLRAAGEAHLADKASFFVEPMVLWSEAGDEPTLRLNMAYLKVGGRGLELEVGRDENWLGPGYRGAITLTSNPRNFDLVKISSPEVISSRYLWDLKYTLIFSRFENTVIDGAEREPYFFAAKVAFKPVPNVELGINLGRQVGGPGVNNGLGDTARGIIGGWNQDNSNSLAGVDLRFRLPGFRYTELYGEFSGEDAAAFWPIVESYLAGFYIPRLTDDGKNDLRFEYFRGNEILYANGTFPSGYLYHGLPVGHSQGGAAEEWFLRYSHWFSVRSNLALEGIHTERGNYGRMTVDASGRFDPNGTYQGVERKNALRAFWTFPVQGEWNALVMYGREWIDNLELRQGEKRENQMLRAELSYRY